MPYGPAARADTAVGNIDEPGPEEIGAGVDAVGADPPFRGIAGFQPDAELFHDDFSCSWCPNHDLLDLVERDLVAGPVIKLGSARTGVGGHLLGLLKRSLVFQVAGDPRRPEAVAAGLGADARLLEASADHPPDIGRAHGI